MPSLHQPTTIPELRQAARQIYTETMRRLELRDVLRRKVRRTGSTLRIDAAEYDLGAARDIRLVAVGKAAFPMAESLIETIRPALAKEAQLQAVVVGTSLPSCRTPGVVYRVGSHPRPDERAFETARDILLLLRDGTPDTLVFFLISGGASAMLDLPLSETISVADLISFHRWLVHSGLPIGEMNTLRKHLSAVKGGRLAVAASPAQQCTLLISDVSPDRPDLVGSGPSLPDPSTLADCRRILASAADRGALPKSILTSFGEEHLPETPKISHPAFTRAGFHMLLSSDDLCQTAAIVAQELGFATLVDLRCDDWHYKDAAKYLLNRLEMVKQIERPVCLISAGELSVPITVEPGVGGRNQQFALYCADELAVGSPAAVILSAGSDGMDGNSVAAGAVVDSTTKQRAKSSGFYVADALLRFDTFPLLHGIGDTIVTGPSGNNLRDLRLLLQNSAA